MLALETVGGLEDPSARERGLGGYPASLLFDIDLFLWFYEQAR